MTDIDRSFGRRAERRAGEIMAEYCPVVPLGDLPGDNGRGPRTNHTGERRVLPDFMAGSIGFVEVKCKGGAWRHNNWDCQMHGIEERHWRDYRAIEREFGKRVVLLILELSTGDVLAATLDDLEAFGRTYRGTWSNNGQQSINWDRRAFTLVGKLRMPDEPEDMTIAFHWQQMEHITHQLTLPFPEAHHA